MGALSRPLTVRTKVGYPKNWVQCSVSGCVLNSFFFRFHNAAYTWKIKNQIFKKNSICFKIYSWKKNHCSYIPFSLYHSIPFNVHSFLFAPNYLSLFLCGHVLRFVYVVKNGYSDILQILSEGDDCSCNYFVISKKRKRRSIHRQATHRHTHANFA